MSHRHLPQDPAQDRRYQNRSDCAHTVARNSRNSEGTGQYCDPKPDRLSRRPPGRMIIRNRHVCHFATLMLHRRSRVASQRDTRGASLLAVLSYQSGRAHSAFGRRRSTDSSSLSCTTVTAWANATRSKMTSRNAIDDPVGQRSRISNHTGYFIVMAKPGRELPSLDRMLGESLAGRPGTGWHCPRRRGQPPDAKRISEAIRPDPRGRQTN